MEGTIVSVKDNFMIKGTRTTAGSRMLENLTASYDATVVQRLEEAGSVVLGKVCASEGVRVE